MKALFILTPSESKRLIAKAVVQMEDVKYAKENGYLAIGRGTTNAYIIEELMGKEIDKAKYVAGQNIKSVLCIVPQSERIKPITFLKGEVLEGEPKTFIDNFGKNDVLIKGANAIDPEGNAGIELAGPGGGTIGSTMGAVIAKGAKLIVPVGLEKLIPSVKTAARVAGKDVFDYSMGAPVGIMPLMYGDVVTEIEALKILSGVEAAHISSGGIDGSEGAVHLAAWGDTDNVNKAIAFVESVKGERPLKGVKSDCLTCQQRCVFQGKKDEELPEYLK